MSDVDGRIGAAPRVRWSEQYHVTYHVVDDVDGFADGTRLEAHVGHAADEVLDRDLTAGEGVEIQLFDLL